ncbi:MAG: hypothetical protein KGY70_02355 [Bacteroidales bacterium]|nr:hypothetical protein [Bacteroidales bacterium]
MTQVRKSTIPVLLATFWISMPEPARNEMRVMSFWTDYYKKPGLVFPFAPNK